MARAGQRRSGEDDVADVTAGELTVRGESVQVPGFQ